MLRLILGRTMMGVGFGMWLVAGAISLFTTPIWQLWPTGQALAFLVGAFVLVTLGSLISGDTFDD